MVKVCQSISRLSVDSGVDKELKGGESDAMMGAEAPKPQVPYLGP